MSNNADDKRFYDNLRFGFAMKKRTLNNMSCNMDAEKKQKLGEMVDALSSMTTLGMSYHMYMKPQLNLEILENAKDIYKFIYDTESINISTDDNNSNEGDTDSSVVLNETRPSKRCKQVRNGREFFTKKAMKSTF